MLKLWCARGYSRLRRSLPSVQLGPVIRPPYRRSATTVLGILLYASISGGPAAVRAAGPASDDSASSDPKVKSVQFLTPPNESPIAVNLAIEGEHFGTNANPVSVQFTTNDPSHSPAVKVGSVTDTEITLSVQALPGTKITNTTVSIGGKKAASNQQITLPSGPIASLPNPAAPEGSALKIDSIKIVGSPQEATVTFKLAIDGENFGTDKSAVTVQFTTNDISHPAEATVDSVTQKEIITSVKTSATSDITKITVTVGNKSIVSPDGLAVSVKPNPPAQPSGALKSFQIKLDHETNTQFPNLHTLIATKASGDGSFGSKVNRIALDLVPAGTADLKVDQISDDTLHLSFVAPADYVPKSLSVTVYDSSDLDTRSPIAVATPAPDSTKTDPNEPKIDHIETVFLNRSQGNGRIRIYGSGFGKYDPVPEGLPLLADDYLRCTVERPYIIAPPDPQKSDAELATQDSSAQNDRRDADPDCKSFNANYGKRFSDWSASIRSAVEPGVRSREEMLDVERTVILYIDDKLVDLYFEFYRRRGYSEPFRLESATLSIRKPVVSVTQTVKAQAETGQVSAPVESAYALSEIIGAQPNPNLTYSYSILDRNSATTLFGAGVARNFYVIKVSITNNGTKKISVPLASIQAEAEWARGTNYRKRDDVVEYFEGPATVSPVPLAAVTAYFNSDYKVTGRRARFFNVLEGITTLSAAVVPFAGPSFKTGNAVFTAGFVPGVHTVVGDLSDQQLQTLAGQSWQSSETVAANGGSIDKFVYIQRNEQFADQPVEYNGPSGTKYRKQAKKKLTNIIGMEVTGTEIEETTSGTATPAAPDQTKPSTGASPAAPTTPTPKPSTPSKPSTQKPKT